MRFHDAPTLWAHIVATLPIGGVVGISGYGGSGKTELGKALGRDKARIQLIHVDDYLDWPTACERNQDGEGVDFQTIVDGHITPFRNKRKPVDYLIIEGIHIFSVERKVHFDFRIWVDTSIEVANANGQARDSENQKLWDEVWVPNELDFAKRHNPQQFADARYSWVEQTT
ncbi:MAG: hypothetical protein R8J94_05380 [Acidimicrobiia bacterium]|nr:hypothetical protein [Acidimicrobiia bacterium]